MTFTTNKPSIGNQVPGAVKTSLSDFIASKNGAESNGAEAQKTESSTHEQNLETEPATPEPKSETREATESTTAVIDSLEAKVKHGDKEFLVKDLINSYETREQIGKRFSEVGSKEASLKKREEALQKAEEEMRKINETFQEIEQLVSEGKNFEALQLAYSLSPNPEATDFEAIVKKSVEVVEKLESMSEEEQAVFWKEKALEAKNRSITKKEKKIKETEEAEVVKNHWNQLVTEHNLTEEEIQATLQKMGGIEGKKEQFEKFTPIQKINDVVTFTLGQRHLSTIREGINKVVPEMANDENLVIALIEHTDIRFNSDQIADIVKDYVAAKKASANGHPNSPKDATDAKNDTVTTPKAPETKPEAEVQKNTPVFNWQEMIAKHSAH